MKEERGVFIDLLVKELEKRAINLEIFTIKEAIEKIKKEK